MWATCANQQYMQINLAVFSSDLFIHFTSLISLHFHKWTYSLGCIFCNIHYVPWQARVERSGGPVFSHVCRDPPSMIKSSVWGLAAHWKKGLLKNQSIINQGCSLWDCQLLLPSSFLLSLLPFCIFISLCFSLLLPLPVQLHVILLNPQPLPLNPSSGEIPLPFPHSWQCSLFPLLFLVL